MFAAYLALIILICASPIAMFVGGNLVVGAEAAFMAVGIALVASEPVPEVLVERSRFVLMLIAVPAVWMVVQLLPLGYAGLANPVWESAKHALGYGLAGSIGVDTGAGILGLVQYLAGAAIILVTLAVTLDRSRADGLLFILMAVATVLSLPAADLLSRLDVTFTITPVNFGANARALGVLFATTAIIRAFERTQSSRTVSKPRLIFSLGAGILCLAVCGSMIAITWTSNLLFSLAFAITIPLAIVAVRWFGIGIWGIGAILAILLTTAVLIVWFQNGVRPFEPMWAYSDNSELIPMTKRILADAPWYGSGVESFQFLVKLYPDQGSQSTTGSTAAAKIAVELGRPALWVAVAITLFLAGTLLRGALRRGRDSFYPALGASLLLALLLRSFGSLDIFSPPVSILAAATIGLALAQISGRTSR